MRPFSERPPTGKCSVLCCALAILLWLSTINFFPYQSLFTVVTFFFFFCFPCECVCARVHMWFCVSGLDLPLHFFKNGAGRERNLYILEQKKKNTKGSDYETKLVLFRACISICFMSGCLCSSCSLAAGKRFDGGAVMFLRCFNSVLGLPLI